MSERGGVGFLQDIPVEVTVELGRARMTIRQLATLEAEDVVELDRGQGELVDLVVGGRVLARGEMVVVKDRVALRIVEVVGASATRNVG
jgi:flagellar motor switch protein FliN/FliY